MVGSFCELLVSYEVENISLTGEMTDLAASQGAAMLNKGRVYSIQDLWIAATAKQLGMRLATANVKDFDHWDELEILNPFG